MSSDSDFQSSYTSSLAESSATNAVDDWERWPEPMKRDQKTIDKRLKEINQKIKKMIENRAYTQKYLTAYGCFREYIVEKHRREKRANDPNDFDKVYLNPIFVDKLLVRSP